MKRDEYRLLKAFQQCHAVGPPLRLTFKELAQSLGVNQKRAAYLAQKWADKGWYNCGVNILLGWLEPAGLSLKLERIMADDSEERFHVGLGLMLTQKEIDTIDTWALEMKSAEKPDEQQAETSQSRSERAEAGDEALSIGRGLPQT